MISNTVQIYQINSEKQENLASILTKTELSIFMLLSDVSRYCSKVYMTRETIAKRVGCCEKTVTRATKRLNELGLIRKYRKFIGKIEKCSYKVMSSYVGMFHRIEKFFDVGPKFPIEILQSSTLQTENVPVVNSSPLEYLYKKFSLSLCKCYNRENSNFGTESYTKGNETKQFFKKISEREEKQDERMEVQIRIDKMIEDILKKKNESKDEMMNKDINVLITPAIAMATEILGLTKCGQCTLRTYSDEAIEYALERLSNASHVNSEWDYVWQEARRYSHENRLEENYTRAINLKLGYAVPDTDRVYVVVRDKNFKKDKPSYNGKQVGYGGNAPSLYPEELKTQATTFAEEEREFAELRKAVEKKLEKHPELEISIFLDLLHETKQGQNALEVMGQDKITVSPAFAYYITKVGQSYRDSLFSAFPCLKTAEVGIWPAFVSPKKTRAEIVKATHDRARKYLSDIEYKNCLIITPFKPKTFKKEETQPVEQTSITPDYVTPNFTFKTMGSVLKDMGATLNNPSKIRNDWNPDDPKSLPF